jgi:hypothetical protein
MFESYRNERRLQKMLKHEDIATYAPLWRVDAKTNATLARDKNGDLKAYLTNSLRPIDPLLLTIPCPGSCSWYSRDRENYGYLHHAAVALVAFMKMRGALPFEGIRFMCIGDEEMYLTIDSVQGDWMQFYTAGAEVVRFPSMLLDNLGGSSRIVGDPYTVKLWDLMTNELVARWKPIVEIVPVTDDKMGAYTQLRDIEGCPGIKEFISYDVIFNIDLLDNSAFPVVDLGVFVKSVKDGYDHGEGSWSLDVDMINVKFGMNPKPQRIKWLKNEHPDNRFFLKETTSAGFHGTCDYKYAAKLPVGFP